MATYNKYESAAEYIANNIIDIFGATHTFKVLLSNTAPNAATHTVKADAAEIAAGGGYTAGGYTIGFTSTRTGGIVTATATDVTITATSGGIATFRYAIIYDDTPSSPADPLLCWYDYASSITLADTEQFVVDFGASFFTFG